MAGHAVSVRVDTTAPAGHSGRSRSNAACASLGVRYTAKHAPPLPASRAIAARVSRSARSARDTSGTAAGTTVSKSLNAPSANASHDADA